MGFTVVRNSYPNIVRDGLVLNVDAGASISYPGSGTTWTDISGRGNNGTLVNGPTYSSANSGSIVFDGTNDYAQSTITLTDAQAEGDLTYEYWVQPTRTINASFTQSTSGTNYYDAGSDQGLANVPSYKYGIDASYAAFQFCFGTNGFVVGAHQQGYAPPFLVDYQSYTGISHLIVIKSGTGCSYYVNGVFKKSASQSKILGAVPSWITSNGAINGSGFGRYFQGNIYAYKLYTRALSAAEILQNYNALLPRFYSIVTSGLVLNLDASNFPSTVEVLVVAGGGGGGARHAGGGGGGGVIYNYAFPITGTTTVTVGDGGIGGTETSGWGVSPVSTNGSNSVFGSLTAIGGGSGGGNSAAGNSGGSGGGGGDTTPGTSLGGSGTSGQGNIGGNSGGNYGGGGGGGGAGGVGGNGSNSGGNGGPGLGFNISETFTYYGGGGGGAAGYNKSSLGGAGGLGGGGRGDNSGSVGAICQNGTPNTGGGGGAHSTNYPTAGSGKAGNGGSGIVIVKYLGPPKATGGTVTFSGGYTIHTFTTVGSTTFTPFWTDISGNGNTGTLVNGPTYNGANYGSIAFDGGDDYGSVSCAQFQSGNNPLTLECWVKWSGNGANTNNIIFGYGADTAANQVPVLYVSSNIFSFNFGSGAGNVNSSTISTNTWYHVVGTYDLTSTKIYVNGILQNTTSYSSANVILSGSNGTNAGIGALFSIYGNVGSPTRYGTFNGNIAKVGHYNRALTAAEVSQNYNATKWRYGI